MSRTRALGAAMVVVGAMAAATLVAPTASGSTSATPSRAAGHSRQRISGSRPASDIESFWSNPSGVPYVTLQRYVTNGSKGFVITCSAGSSAFASQRATCELILSTFRVD